VRGLGAAAGIVGRPGQHGCTRADTVALSRSCSSAIASPRPLAQNPGSTHKEPAMHFGGSYSLIGILILIADIWAIINIAQSSAENLKKAIWIVLIVVLPVLGLILWLLFGPRGRSA
jgi:hypothetical protein